MSARSEVLLAKEGRPDPAPEVSVFLQPELRALYRRSRDVTSPTALEENVGPVADRVITADPTAVKPDAPSPQVAVDEPVAQSDVVTIAAAAPTETPTEDWTAAPCSDLHLRQDGKRALCFRGLLIAEGAVDSWLRSGARVRQSISLWSRSDGSGVLRMTLETPDALVMRPIHRLTDSSNADAFGIAIAAHDPIDGFADLPFLTVAAMAEARREADSLRRDFHTLAGLVLGTRPVGQETEEEPIR